MVFNTFGGAKRDRTADLLNAIQALSQLSQTVANAADAQRPAGGNVQIDLAPERGEQEIRGHHGGQSQAEHIVMET